MTRVAPLGLGVAVHHSVDRALAAKQLGLDDFLVMEHPKILNGYVIMPIDVALESPIGSNVWKKMPNTIKSPYFLKKSTITVSIAGVETSYPFLVFASKFIRCINCKHEVPKLLQLPVFQCYKEYNPNPEILKFVFQSFCPKTSSVYDPETRFKEFCTSIFAKVLIHKSRKVFGKEHTPHIEFTDGIFSGVFPLFEWKKVLESENLDLEVLKGDK